MGFLNYDISSSKIKTYATVCPLLVMHSSEPLYGAWDVQHAYLPVMNRSLVGTWALRIKIRKNWIYTRLKYACLTQRRISTPAGKYNATANCLSLRRTPAA